MKEREQEEEKAKEGDKRQGGNNIIEIMKPMTKS
jgi:hypothetical protein